MSATVTNALTCIYGSTWANLSGELDEMDVCSKSELAAILSRFTNPRVAAAELVAAAEGHEPAPFDRGATALVVSFR